MAEDTSSESVPRVEPTPVFVRARGRRWELVDRASGAVIAVFGTRDAALDAALDAIEVAPKEPYLRDPVTRAPIGEWRWMDATAVEEPSGDGAPRIGEQTIEEMAARLNASPMARPIDGGRLPDGYVPSEVHGTADDSGTPANGWVHAGVPVIDARGRMHLYLRAELLPEIAIEFDRGRLAHGSVHVRGEGVDESGVIVGAELASHALTNDPAVQTLAPSSAVFSAGRRAVVLLHAKGKTMMRETMKSAADLAAEFEVAQTRIAELAKELEAAQARIAELEKAIAANGDEDEEEEEEYEKAAKALEAAQARISVLEAERELLLSEAARAREGKAETERMRAEALVESAVKDGRIEPDDETRAKWVDLAVRDYAHVEKTLARLRPIVPTSRQAKSQEAAPRGGGVGELDPTDPTVRAMRAAGLSDQRIKVALAKRRGAEV